MNADSKTALVEPGAVLDNVNRALARYRLMVGPKPSTHVSCTIGGMIGNNSCGSTAQAYGKMADSVRRLEVLGWDGRPVRDTEAFASFVEAGFTADGPRLTWDGYPGPRA